MSEKAAKLIKQFCDQYHRDFHTYLKNYIALDRSKKAIVRAAIKKSISKTN